VNGGLAPVVDPGDATVRVFFRGDFLYLGFDVRDEVVQYHPSFDRCDGFLVSINDRAERDPLDHILKGRRLSFRVGPNGAAEPQDYLTGLVQAGTAQLAIALKPGTTVDTLGLNVDAGYWAELRIDLKALGYPAGLGDGALFLGIDLLDGDSFDVPSDSYGTRTWWYREYENNCCAVWAYMDPEAPVSDVAIGGPGADDGFVLLGSHPNPAMGPARRASIEYALPVESAVTLEVFDVQGRLVHEQALGVQEAGRRSVEFDATGRNAGLYLYRLRATDPATGALRSELSGRMVVLE
jgi:hypothetical protein